MDAQSTASAPAANDSPSTARQQSQQPPPPQQQQSQPLQQQPQPQQSHSLQTTSGQSLVVATSSSSGSIPLVSSGNAVVLSASNQITGLMTQAAGVAQNSIRLQPQQQPQLIMAPVNTNMVYGNFLPGTHQVMTQGGQFIIQNLNTMSNSGIFQLPHSNITTIGGRRSAISTGQNIQPRPQSQLLPATPVYRTNLSSHIIAQSSGVSTTPTNIQPRPQQSFIPTSPISIRAANIGPQLFPQQSYQSVYPQNQTGLCWAGQPGTLNSGYIIRSQNDPIQFLSSQSPLQFSAFQNNVQVPAPTVPVVSVAPAVAAPLPTPTPAAAAPTAPRMKPIAVRPATGSTSTSTSMGTQTALRTTTTVAEATKIVNVTRTKVVSGPGRPAAVTSSPSKPVNGPGTPVRESDATSSRSSPATTSHPPAVKTDVLSANSAIANTADSKGDVKLAKVSPVTGKNSISGNHHNNKEISGDRVPSVRRTGDKRDENLTNCAVAGKKSESPRLRNGIKSLNECKKVTDSEKASPEILIHVIEEYVIEESSKPFPVNGNTEPPVAENGRSDRSISRTDSPEELVISTPRPQAVPADVGECQKCQNTGPKSRLKLRNGMRLCQTCFSKRPASKLDLMNTVTGSPSEYDFRDNDVQHIPKGAAAPPDSDAVTDSRKKARISKRAAAGASDVPIQQVMKATDKGAGPETGSSTASTDAHCHPIVNAEVADLYLPKSGSNPLKWDVEDVYDFVRHLEGCKEYAEEFKSQEIDGQALLLLEEKHLMTAMKMRLGPALKICSKINALKEESGGKAA